MFGTLWGAPKAVTLARVDRPTVGDGELAVVALAAPT
jgi:hypothetical protein